MPRRLAIIGPYQVAVHEYDEPPLGAGEVRVATELASGKHGTTFGMFDGRTFEGQRFDQEMRLFVPEERQVEQAVPHSSGTTGVGVVTAVGPEVTCWRVGDRVFGLMDVRETNVCHQDRLWALGEIDPLLALCVEPAYVAFHCVRESLVRYGESVAVVGLGALGLLALRMAIQGGAEAVYAVDALPRRRAWAAEHGADLALDPAACDPALEIHRATGGKGVDVAVELAGAYPALNTAIRSVRVGGTVCSAGFFTRARRTGCGWGASGTTTA